MKQQVKKFSLTLIFALMLLISTLQLPKAHSQVQDTSTEKALEFMTKVIGLDMKNYSVQAKAFNYSENIGGALFDKMIKYNLTSGRNKLDVICLFRGDKLVWCTIYPIKGSVLFAQTKSTDTLSNAKSIIERLQNYSSTSYIPTLRDMLETTATYGNSIKTMGEVTQKIAVKDDVTDFVWSYNANGIENNYKVVVLALENGSFQFFCDNWDLYKIGNTDVRVSQEKAIEIAKEHSFKTYSLSSEPDFGVLDKNAMVSLTMQDRGNYTLYPHWDILLPLDKAYGAVTAIRVLVWADTGEVSYIAGVGSGGIPQNQDTTSDTAIIASETPIEQGYVMAGVLIAAVTVVILGYLFYKRRK